MLILIPCLFNLALSLDHDLSVGLSMAPSPIIQSSQALLPLHNRGSSGASTNHQDPLICLRFRLKTVTKFLPTQAGATALTASFSQLHASDANSWTHQPYLQSIPVNHGRLQLSIYFPIPTIPWCFIASFAKDMLQAIPKGGIYVSSYEGYQS